MLGDVSEEEGDIDSPRPERLPCHLGALGPQRFGAPDIKTFPLLFQIR